MSAGTALLDALRPWSGCIVTGSCHTCGTITVLGKLSLFGLPKLGGQLVDVLREHPGHQVALTVAAAQP